RELRGVTDERSDTVADQAYGGLESRDQQADRLRDQLRRAETVALLLGADEPAQDVVSERTATPLDELCEVGGERHAGGARLVDHLGGQDGGGEPVRRFRRPHREAVAIGGGHA